MMFRRNSLVITGFLIAFGIGLFARFAALSRVPLTDAEATLAWQALDLARGNPVEFGPHPAYVLLTSALFFLFGSGDGLARFWPALAGSLMVLAPWLYRRFLGVKTALILAFILAVEPGIVAVSRQAGGPILALTSLALALGFWFQGRAVGAGIFAGLALLGGPQMWPVLLVVALVYFIFSNLMRMFTKEPDADESVINRDPDEVEGEYQVLDENLEVVQPVRRADWRTGLVAFLAMLLLIGTLFMTAPAGLSGAMSSLAVYLRGWVTPEAGISPLLVLLALVFYSLFVLLGGLVELVAGNFRRSLVDDVLAVTLIIALLYTLIYPSRQISDLAWPILLLSVMTARLLSAWLDSEDVHWPAAIAQAGLAVVLLGFAWMNTVALYNPLVPQESLREEAIYAALGLLLITSLLMVWGWSFRSMRMGMLTGLIILLSIFTVSNAVNAAGLGRNPQAELWRAEAVVSDQMLRKTVSDLGLWGEGDSRLVDVAVVGFNSPSLRWTLRDVSQLDSISYLPPQAQPSIIITPDQTELAAANAYRGQNFVWTRVPAWNLLDHRQWMRWLIFRNPPTEATRVILWARNDLFPGGDQLVPNSNTP